MGNGDGTFTPTYDVFDFQKTYGFPAYAHILDGSTVSDLLEVDGATTSMHVFKGGPAPALQLALEESRITGTSGCGWVFLNLPSNSDTSITLSSSEPGVILPAAITVPASSLSQQFCYTLSSTYEWHHVFDIRAQLNGDTAVAYASQSYVVGFSEDLSPASDQAIYATQSTTPITVSVTAVPGYSSTVQLSCIGLLAGENCNFGQDALTISPSHPGSTTLMVTTSASTSGVAPVTVIASDSNITQRQAFNLAVVPLYVVALGGLVEATSPGSGTGQITINGIPPYTPSCSGLPSGVSCSFIGSQPPYPSQSILTFTVNVPSGVTPANYPFSVGVASGPAQASVPFSLSIGDFGLQPPSGSAWVLPGDTATVTAMAQSVNSFSSTITVSCTLATGSCTGGSFSVSPNGTPLNLTVVEPSGVSPVSETLTVTGTYGPIAHTISFPFYVADYIGTLSTSALTMARGGTSTLTATLNATAGFSSSVSFGCSGSAQLSCSFSPSTIQLVAGSSQTTTITVSASGLASVPHANDSGKIRFAMLFLPFGVVVAGIAKKRSRVMSVAIGLLVLSLSLELLDCGGANSTGGGGDHGSSNYTITVTAGAAVTNSTKTLGTVDVTVTH